jgi:hypothetical protein
VVVTVLAACWVFLPAEVPLELPEEPRVDAPPEAGAVLGADKLFAVGSYWDESARYVFAEPEAVRVFKPVELDVPVVEPPKMVMPLGEPGPLLRYTDGLPRLDGSEPAGSAAPDPAPKPAPAPGAGAAGGGG